MMSKKVNADVLPQWWVHSHEEDTEAEMVFRPATFNFPPSRGRISFDLKPDGSLAESGIAPDDRRLETKGTWKLEDDNTLAFYTGSQSAPHRVMRITSVDKDRLVIKK
ncbi:hypothetical protein HYR54_00770 [Candidatus Acetothermia bacterium]|nr:hypothetical protein [Candidatus Acetothermia bacterium]MBI3461049.1 hypothetical protein [Candidatus Acetothermia bacterium]